MPKIKNVSLDVELEETASKNRKVTISGEVSFTKTEIGKKYKLALALYGEDLEGDIEGFPSGTNEESTITRLYTFSFLGVTNGFFQFKNALEITASKPKYSFSEVRLISSKTLNEDPGYVFAKNPPHNPIKVPVADEVFAKALIWQSGTFFPVESAISETVVGVFD